MASSQSVPHATWSIPYSERAYLPNTTALTSYLFRLISTKKTNLCLSADVDTSTELLRLANITGDSICVLKTHADIIKDFSERTWSQLREIADRKKFLIFEDRKFGDIGSTVQKQYTSGPLQIARWAEITNAHVFPGPAIVEALKQAAEGVVSKYNSGVRTEISAGGDSRQDEETELPEQVQLGDAVGEAANNRGNGRKGSVVSISTTISQTNEPLGSRNGHTSRTNGMDSAAPDIEFLDPIPFHRSLLLLAEMSSAGNLLTGAYTQTCIDIARQYPSFVMGFIAQRSLNTLSEDNFITMTPGVNLPAEGAEAVKGDNLGQQYNTPHSVIYDKGCDVIIVGRGIIKADDPKAEAERYRKAAWEAYEARIARK